MAFIIPTPADNYAPAAPRGRRLAAMSESEFSALMVAWRLHGLASNHSMRTITARAYTIRRLAYDLDPLSVTTADLTRWLGSVTNKTGEPIARSSRATYRAHLRSFFSWACESGLREDDPSLKLPQPRAPRGVPRPVSPADVTRILHACDDPRAASTRAYVTLAAYAGLRVHEIAKLRAEDYTGAEILVTGKGSVASSVPAHPLVQALAASLPRYGYWFPAAEKATGGLGHVHRCSVGLAIKRAMTRAGVAGTPHALRHHYGTQVLVASGGNLRVAQRALRHASVATTAIYTQVADESLSAAISSIPAGAC